ncbi:metal-dependent hydrolase [Actinospongicola halichondriae]|uniref:metal-dependent hydrolase n=1 Tax=Actinospongicola halichondriae TaxID=3236844 RepID=UPI003D4F054C
MTNASVARQTSDPDRTFPVRRITFEEVIDGLTADFAADDDVLMCHMVAALSGLFPDGEEMFIDSVKHYRDEITDQDLKRQVNAFIGQEVTHGREHRRLNERLAELGYRSKMVEDLLHRDEVITPGMRRVIKLISRFGPLREINEQLEREETIEPEPIFMLAMTAALEHYTATMAETLLTERELQERFADQDFFRMWAWHAIEECEHKAVAFDVYKAVGGDEETRRKAMKLATYALAFITGYHTIVGALKDRRSYRNFNLVRSLWRNRNNPLFGKRLRERLADYDRADFHPLQHDSTLIEAQWRAWLDDDAARPAVA